MPKISIIIPCYNSGAYLPEAIDSITNYTRESDYEVIIVNDGSSDEKTINLLKELSKSYTVINQENKGPAAARNTGIKNCKGDYLLFLDSDNKLLSGFIDKAINLFNNDENLGVVYADSYFFGDSNVPRFKTEAFDFEKLLFQNYIDMFAMIRKIVWTELGGLDENRILIGREDWDFWLRVSKTKWKFHFIDQKFQQYRIREQSLMSTIGNELNDANVREYVYSKHIDMISKIYPRVYMESKIYENDKKRPLRSFFKYIYLKLKK